MKEAMAVTGYVPDAVAKTLNDKGAGAVDVYPERGVDEVAARIQKSEIAEARVGSSSRGTTLVQLILAKDATVETVVRTKANAKGLQRFYDPNLARLRQAAMANVIMA
jgi:hypothetical protein